jgi:hypothetical protein
VAFDDESLQQIATVSRGVPQVVNRICERAIAAGFEASASVIDRSLVRRAASALGLVKPAARARASALKWAAAVLFALAVAAGAVTAGYLFREDFRAMIVRWQAVPPAPARVAPPIHAPLTPLPAPPRDPLAESGP